MPFISFYPVIFSVIILNDLRHYLFAVVLFLYIWFERKHSFSFPPSLYFWSVFVLCFFLSFIPSSSTSCFTVFLSLTLSRYLSFSLPLQWSSWVWWWRSSSCLLLIQHQFLWCYSSSLPFFFPSFIPSPNFSLTDYHDREKERWWSWMKTSVCSENYFHFYFYLFSPSLLFSLQWDLPWIMTTWICQVFNFQPKIPFALHETGTKSSPRVCTKTKGISHTVVF